MKLKKIINFLDKELSISTIDDVSKNGLQVQGRDDVKRIGFAVDACLESLRKAKTEGCDMLIVHHGLFWNDAGMITGRMYKLIRCLIDNRISLYAAHLPLDKHPKYGNNIQLAFLLGLKNVKEFGKYNKSLIGFSGNLKKEMFLKDLLSLIDKKLNTESRCLAFGKKKVKTVAVSSGKSDSLLDEAIDKKIDVFFTGEATHDKYHPAKEGNINLITSGHYATETLGLKAVSKLLKQKFNIETCFINVPTGM